MPKKQNRNSIKSVKDNMNDEVLIEKVKKGDKYSFNLLVWKWEKQIYNLAVRMLGSVEDAADACQDIFIAAYEKAHSFKGNSKFSTWLYRIAINNCISKLRRKKIEQKIYDNSLLQASLATKDSAIRDDETTLIKNQLSERIMKAIQKLPDEQKAILELKIYQDLSFEEISKIIGIPVGTAKSRLHYALIKIRNELKDLNPNNPNNMR
jgi:RNA polymerase sigma-70 factor (ECF subfamily)